MKSILLSFMLFLGIITAFSAPALAGNGKSEEAVLEDVDAIQALAIANQWRWSKKDINSYVNSREVGFKFPDGKAIKIPLPQEKMVVAVAPYIKQTHGWVTHSLSSCQGELNQQKFQVRAVDQDGNILLDETMTTLQNGFFELWLPRNRRISLEVKRGNLTAKGAIETLPGSKTCETTFQLHEK